MKNLSKIAYEILAERNPDVIGAIERAIVAGATVSQIEAKFRRNYGTGWNVVNLAVAALDEIEERMAKDLAN